MSELVALQSCAMTREEDVTELEEEDTGGRLCIGRSILF